jgi:glutamine amidotransferase
MYNIGILDLDLGNILAVERMVKKSGWNATLVKTPEALNSCNKLIIPGVGSFNTGMKRIADLGLYEPLIYVLNNSDIPVLGICLGMQLLCLDSEEGSRCGLGVIDAHVQKFKPEEISPHKIPHMGWNYVNVAYDNPILPISNKEQKFYFVHSYYVKVNDPSLTMATTVYGREFCSCYRKNNIFGVQFHPEKSHRFGLNLIQNFVKI